MLEVPMISLALALTNCTTVQAAPSASPSPSAASGVEYCTESHRGVTYHWVRADPARVRVQAYWQNERNQPIRSLESLESWLRNRGQVLLVGMNGGIFHTDRTPVGLLVSEGITQDTLNRRTRPPRGEPRRGSFYVQPNGVFFVTDDGALHITTTPEAVPFLGRMSAATQSGPLLVRNGQFTPAYLSADTLSPWTNTPAQRAQELLKPGDLPTRNAVCLGRDGFLYLVLTETGVRGDPFARFLRDRLRCRDALFLDGSYSALHVPGRRAERRADLVTLIAVLPR